MKPVFLVLVTMMWLGCTDHTFPPKFKVTKESIIADIQNIIKAERIHIEGYKIPIDDSVSLWLTVGIINPRNLPKDHALVMDMRKRIAVIVKNALKDPYQFKVYDIGVTYSKVTGENFFMQKVEAHSIAYGQFDVDEL
ncbi:MAG TPA: hypothetical protein VF622_14775 [Segetibacter sp.]|jgi:hypothetical protein